MGGFVAGAGLEGALGEKGVDVNQEDQDGTKLLHVAAALGTLQALKVGLCAIGSCMIYALPAGVVSRHLVAMLPRSCIQALRACAMLLLMPKTSGISVQSNTWLYEIQEL